MIRNGHEKNVRVAWETSVSLVRQKVSEGDEDGDMISARTCNSSVASSQRRRLSNIATRVKVSLV